VTKPVKILLPVAALFLLIIAFLPREASDRHTEPAVIGEVSDFALIKADGEEFRLSDLDEKYWIAGFFFTRCTAECSLLASNIEDLLETFERFNNVHFVLTTVDPTHDTPEVLSEYAASRSLDAERWHLLTGEYSEIERFMQEDLKLASGESPSMHTTRLVLVDNKSQIRGYYQGIDDEAIQRLKTDLLILLGS